MFRRANSLTLNHCYLHCHVAISNAKQALSQLPTSRQSCDSLLHQSLMSMPLSFVGVCYMNAGVLCNRQHTLLA